MQDLDASLATQMAELHKAVTTLLLHLMAKQPECRPVADVEHESVKARGLYAERRRREKHFGTDGGLFGEP